MSIRNHHKKYRMSLKALINNLNFKIYKLIIKVKKRIIKIILI